MGFFQKLKERQAWNDAMSLEEAGRLREARDAFRSIGTGEALVRAGALSSRLGELGLARQLLDQAIKLVPNSVEAHFHLASVCLELRDTARADELFHSALKLAPDRVDILYLQSVYYAQRMPKAGLESAKRTIRTLVAQLADPLRTRAFEALQFPRELPLIFIRNLALEQQLVPEGTAALTEFSLEVHPSWLRVAAFLHLGLLLANTGHYDNAMAVYQQALTLDPHLHEAHYNLAMAFMRSRNFDAARTEISLYAKLYPRSPITTYGFALMAETRGDLAETIRLYRFFLERQAHEPPPPQQMIARLDLARTWVDHAKQFLEAVERHERAP